MVALFTHSRVPALVAAAGIIRQIQQATSGKQRKGEVTPNGDANTTGQ